MYPPLELAKQLNISDIPDTNKAKEYLLDAESGNNELLLLLNEHTGFGTTHYNGPYKEFSDYIHRQWKNIYRWATGCEPDRDVFNRSNRASVLDSFAGMILCSRWNRYKQVYRFDAELEFAFATVDEIKLPLSMFTKLPYKSFYIEFAPDGIFAQAFHGSFVDVIAFSDAVSIKYVRLTKDLRTMSGAGTFKIDKSKTETFVTIKRTDVDGKHENDVNGLRIDWEEFCFFAFNAMMYLCASNAEIRKITPKKEINKEDEPEPSRRLQIESDNEITADNKVTINECGYVYGQTVRLLRKERDLIEKTTETNAIKTRKSPRPHPVKASWQHYWKGKGSEKRRVLVFKDAYFAGGVPNVATVHKVI